MANLLGIAIAMAIAAGIPACFPRAPIPAVVLEILIGALMGPQLLGIIGPGPAIPLLSGLGLSVLFLIAGFEVNPAVLRGRPIRNALAGWILTAVIAFGAAWLLSVTGVATAPLLTGLALTTTTLGALLPVLRDSRLLVPPYGPMVLAAGAIGEALPVVGLSLILAGSRHTLSEAMILVAFGAASAGAIILAARSRTTHLADIVKRSIGTSGQFPLRLALCVLIALVALSGELKIDLVLGAFVAGAMVRASLPEEHHEALSARLDGLGYAFFVPIFFVISGMQLDVVALFSDLRALLMVPVYALLMLVARGAPALWFYRADLSFRQRAGLALHSGTQLSVVVAITSIAAQRGLMPAGQAAALVGGGILTMMLYPALARQLLQDKTESL